MKVAPPPRGTIAQRQFVIGANAARVWDLLATVTYQQLPLEQVDIVSLDTFRAVLRWGSGFIRFSFHVEGKLVDTIRPHSYGCVLRVKKGPIQIGVRVTLALREIHEGNTEVFCTAVEERKGALTGLVLRRLQRNLALKMFDSIGARLEWLCS